MENLAGRVAVVTGAASGLGRAMAVRFATQEMRLVLADIDRPTLHRLADELRENGAEIETYTCDVSRREEVEELAVVAYGSFGAVHLLCNNAGVALAGPTWAHSEKDWSWIVGVNLLGVAHGVSVFVPRMLASGEEGHIVNTSSIAGLIAPGMMGAYCATKHAVVGLSESLYHELGASGSRLGVSVLCPGFVTTRIHESSRNRPSALRESDDALDPLCRQMEGVLKQLIESGSAPEKVADAVVDAVRQNRFWILTHPELDGAIQRRAKSVLERENPATVPIVPSSAKPATSS